MLVLTRKDNESWLQAALRYAEPWGLEGEVEDCYHNFLKEGYNEEVAAFEACYEWDILDFEDVDIQTVRG